MMKKKGKGQKKGQKLETSVQQKEEKGPQTADPQQKGGKRTKGHGLKKKNATLRDGGTEISNGATQKTGAKSPGAKLKK